MSQRDPNLHYLRHSIRYKVSVAPTPTVRCACNNLQNAGHRSAVFDEANHLGRCRHCNSGRSTDGYSGYANAAAECALRMLVFGGPSSPYDCGLCREPWYGGAVWSNF
jgi:hypothetical protein